MFTAVIRKRMDVYLRRRVSVNSYSQTLDIEPNPIFASEMAIFQLRWSKPILFVSLKLCPKHIIFVFFLKMYSLQFQSFRARVCLVYLPLCHTTFSKFTLANVVDTEPPTASGLQPTRQLFRDGFIFWCASFRNSLPSECGTVS